MTPSQEVRLIRAVRDGDALRARRRPPRELAAGADPVATSRALLADGTTKAGGSSPPGCSARSRPAVAPRPTRAVVALGELLRSAEDHAVAVRRPRGARGALTRRLRRPRAAARPGHPPLLLDPLAPGRRAPRRPHRRPPGGGGPRRPRRRPAADRAAGGGRRARPALAAAVPRRQRRAAHRLRRRATSGPSSRPWSAWRGPARTCRPSRSRASWPPSGWPRSRPARRSGC